MLPSTIPNRFNSRPIVHRDHHHRSSSSCSPHHHGIQHKTRLHLFVGSPALFTSLLGLWLVCTMRLKFYHVYMYEYNSDARGHMIRAGLSWDAFPQAATRECHGLIKENQNTRSLWLTRNPLPLPLLEHKSIVNSNRYPP